MNKYYQMLSLVMANKRVQCAKNGDFASMTGSAVNYAWFVFEKGHSGTTNLHWIT